MHKAVFLAGTGTLYNTNGKREALELYPETLPALRFLARRGFRLVLVTAERQEHKNFLGQLKDRTFPVQYFNPAETELADFVLQHRISLEGSYFVTDKLWPKALTQASSVVLVLSGKGFCTLAECQGKPDFAIIDVCKDIYASAFSIVIKES